MFRVICFIRFVVEVLFLFYILVEEIEVDGFRKLFEVFCMEENELGLDLEYLYERFREVVFVGGLREFSGTRVRIERGYRFCCVCCSFFVYFGRLFLR